MQLYSFIRGPLRNQQRMLEEMQAQPFKFKHNNKNYWINWTVRPIQFVEHVFPKEFLHMILNSIPGKSDNGFPPLIKKLIKAKLHLKDIPEPDPKVNKRIIFGDGMQNVLIGIKDDNETALGEMI